ncbi:MAG: response regulator [Endomicrobiales bacterium]|nr:response regulator [Endomicrobiales bacterium]
MKELYTTFEIAKLCNVDITTVINWVKTGKLQAYKTPGGHRRIHHDEFMKFIKEYNLPLPKDISQDSQTVLIVDDEEPIRKTIRKILQRKWPDMHFYEAEDGFIAGKLLAEKKPSLVILDIRLPGIDGIQVCQQIKSDPRLVDTKILAITGYFSPVMKQSIIKAGASDCLAKPLSSDKLIQYVSNLI